MKLIRSEIDPAFQADTNIGMKEALERGAEFILIVNNDTIVDPDMIKNLLEILERNLKLASQHQKFILPKVMNFIKIDIKKKTWEKFFGLLAAH